MQKLLRTRSLRFWLAFSITLVLTPLAASAVTGYFLLNHGVVAAFQDVASRQREQIDPVQNLRLLMWDGLAAVDEFVETGNGTRVLAYRALRQRIESGFSALAGALADDRALAALVERARDDWTDADRTGTELISVQWKPGDPDAIRPLETFHGKIAAASDRLTAAYEQLDAVLRHDHDSALRFYERTIWIAGIAAFVAALAAVGGILLIGRVMSASIDRLVDGASRFAEGDRSHRIDVQVPPELRRVAEEFNYMIGRIDQYETMLADLAHRDGLTGLLNRRAFEEVLSEALAKTHRTGRTAALLSIDVDHFKRVNDTYGHAAGDDVLRSVAAALSGCLRPFDHVFRVGGEEFAVVIDEADAADAEEIAERIRQAVKSRPTQSKDAEVAATVSIGVAIGSSGIRSRDLTEAADLALYQAKESGRDRVVVRGVVDGRQTSVA